MMLGIQVVSGTDANGVNWTELKQTDYINDLHAMAVQYMPPNFKVSTPFPPDKKMKLSLLSPDGACNKPPPEEIARTHAKQFRTFVGMLLWISRNTKIALATGLSFLTRVMATPGDVAFEALLHMIQYVYQERDSGLMFRADQPVVPVTWYDASDDKDPLDSITIGGGLICMCGAAVSWNCGKLLHVGNAGSSHAEYMQLERTMRSVIWLRELFKAAQIYRATIGDTVLGTFGKLTRLSNRAPVYYDLSSGYMLKYIFFHEGVNYGTKYQDTGATCGRWAIISAFGTADIMLIARDTSPLSPANYGPDSGTEWTKPSVTGEYVAVDDATVVDLLRIAEIVDEPSVVVGDNINALKWASVDAITPGNKHVRTAYHWVKEHVRDDDVCLRDGPSATNLADFLTKNLQGPAVREMYAASSGYASHPPIPKKLQFIT